MTGTAGAGAQAFNAGVAFNGAPGGGMQIFIPMSEHIFRNLSDEGYNELLVEVAKLVANTMDSLRNQ